MAHTFYAVPGMPFQIGLVLPEGRLTASLITIEALHTILIKIQCEFNVVIKVSQAMNYLLRWPTGEKLAYPQSPFEQRLVIRLADVFGRLSKSQLNNKRDQ